jgi:phage I-like protein
MKLKNGYLILSESISVNGVPENIKILPLGNVNSRKGNFLVDETSFKEMQQYFTDRQIDVVIDYEHQTLEGTEAPAAGWIKDLKLTDEGVVAKVDWTDRAKEYLKNKEYRYLSPVIFKRKSDGRAIVLHSVALTNTPAIDGMEPIVNNLNFLKGGKEDMNEFLKKLAVLLGLDENATEEEIIEAIKKLAENEKAPEGNEEEIVANKEILEALELDEKATVEDVKGKIIALKNPAGYVSAEDFTKRKDTRKGK